MLFQTTKTFLQGTNDKMFGDRRVFELVAWSVLVDCLQVMISFSCISLRQCPLRIVTAASSRSRGRRQQTKLGAVGRQRASSSEAATVLSSPSPISSYTSAPPGPLLLFDPLICGRRLGPRPTLSNPTSVCGVRPPPELGRSSPAGGSGTPTRPHPRPRALAGSSSPPPPTPPGRW